VTNEAEREVMGLLLTTNAELVASVLRGPRESDADSVMVGVAATRSLGLIVDDVLHALVQQARQEGHTWAEVGSLLHVSRQAAFQRFGAPSSDDPGHDDATPPLPDAADRALVIIQHVHDERWDLLYTGFTERARNALSEEVFRSQRARAKRRFGAYISSGVPTVGARHGYTIVDVPMTFEIADITGRVTFNAEGKVAGLAFEPNEPWDPIDGDSIVVPRERGTSYPKQA